MGAGTIKKLQAKSQTGAPATQAKSGRSATDKKPEATENGASGVDKRGAAKQDPAPASPKKPHHLLRGQKSLQNFFSTEKSADKDKKALLEKESAESKGGYESKFHPFHLRHNTSMYEYKVPGSFDIQSMDKVIARLQSPGDSTDNLDASQLLLELKSASKEARAKPTRRMQPICDGVELDSAEVHLLKLRESPMKLLHFYDNRRPDYWGTWTRTLSNVSARRPFAKDPSVLDYDVDSDAEWGIEEDEEGEELKSEDEEEDDDEEDDDEDDEEDDEDFDENNQNGFIVGDDYAIAKSFGLASADAIELESNSDSDSQSEFNSEDEAIEDINPEEEVSAVAMDIDEPEEPQAAISTLAQRVKARSSRRRSTNPVNVGDEDARLHKQKQRQQRKRVVPLTPIVIGLAWSTNSSDMAADSKASMLSPLTISCIDSSLPLSISIEPQPSLTSKKHSDSRGPSGSSTATKSDAPANPTNAGRKPRDITDEELLILVGIVHGSPNGIQRLVEDIKAQIPDASKKQIERLIHKHAVKEKRPPSTRPIWCVNEEMLGKARAARKSSTPAQDESIDATRSYADTLKCLQKPSLGAANDLGREENAAKRQRTNGSPC
ncbi:hypothetical protein GGI12_004340 [Dipsacomyces acuminosporus]|nr:hypothetical protein GGI12_004340 [Dipsacomyces acuminosporus]